MKLNKSMRIENILGYTICWHENRAYTAQRTILGNVLSVEFLTLGREGIGGFITSRCVWDELKSLGEKHATGKSN